MKLDMFMCQFIDLDSSQRSDPFAVHSDKLNETLAACEDYINQFEEVKNLAVLVVSEHVQLDKNGEIVTDIKISKAPIMKFQTFKKVMEQKYNEYHSE